MQKITILLMFLCTVTLNSMEKENNYIEQGKTFLEKFQSLPADLQKEVMNLQRKLITAEFLASKNINEAVTAIEAADIVGICYKNLNDFNRFVHILANKFRTSTKIAAEKLRTPLANTYLKINNELLLNIKLKDDNTQTVSELIHNGADINFTSTNHDPLIFIESANEDRSPLHLAVKANKLETVKLLLSFNAKIHWAEKQINKNKFARLERKVLSLPSFYVDYKQAFEALSINTKIHVLLNESLSKK